MEVSCMDKPSPKPSRHLLSLPTEMLLEIFSYFSDDTAAVRKVLAPVCKDFYELTKDASLLGRLQFYSQHREWRKIMHVRFERFCNFLLALDGRLSHVNTLIINLQQRPYFSDRVEICGPDTWALLCSKLHSLETLLIQNAELSSKNFIAALPPSLIHLHLVRCVLANDSFKAFQDDNFLPQLKCLQFQSTVEDYNLDREFRYLSRAGHNAQVRVRPVSTAPCGQLHGLTRPDISKLCCRCPECKREVEMRWCKTK